MKKLLATLTIVALLSGCASSPQTLQQYSLTAPPDWKGDRETIKGQVDKISSKLDASITNQDDLSDYWDKMILLPLEPYTAFDSGWQDYLDQKAKEYTEVTVPKCKSILIEGFKEIGVTPKETSYRLLRAEFILVCWGNSNRERVRMLTFKKLSDNINTFFTPIYEKAKTEAMNNYREVDAILEGNTANLSVHKIYKILFNFASQEKDRLDMRNELDNKYSPILQSLFNKWKNSLSPQQTKEFSSMKDNGPEKFIKTLTPEQFALFEWILFKYNYIESERKVWQKRIAKLTKLEQWLKEYESKAENSLQQEQYVRGATARAVLGTLLMGVAAFAGAYTAWNSAYYTSYQYQAPPIRNFSITDYQRGKTYLGTIY
jgi:hypothetical protein